jgi:16S rRNA (cytosine1402-N4)-methyltransferase
MSQHHKPVLLQEVASIFNPIAVKTFIDATLGAGGHAKRILVDHPEIEQYMGIDQDASARAIAASNLESFGSVVRIIPGNFSEMRALLDKEGVAAVDGILMDIGISSMHVDEPGRGFSFMNDGPLDMRMDPDNNTFTAAKLVNEWSEPMIGEVLRDYGEEKLWRRAARALVQARRIKKITTTKDLVRVLTPLFPFSPRKKGIHPLTLIFQALRICVNDELGALRTALPQAMDLLAPGGRLCVISFHSLEDGIVKNMFRDAAQKNRHIPGAPDSLTRRDPKIKILTKKPLKPSDAEVRENSRCRSACLRAVEKI